MQLTILAPDVYLELTCQRLLASPDLGRVTKRLPSQGGRFSRVYTDI